MKYIETNVFVSYSHADESLVTPIVHVIRAVGGSVFQDIDSIPYGKRWRPVIETSIESANLILVFWCEHSRQSVEVRKEWQFAIQAQKDVVPVLLDDTVIESELAEFQAVDLRSLAPLHAIPYQTPGTGGVRSSLGVGRLFDLLESVLGRLFGGGHSADGSRSPLGFPDNKSETGVVPDNLRHGAVLDADSTAAAAAYLLNYLKWRATRGNGAP